MLPWIVNTNVLARVDVVSLVAYTRRARLTAVELSSVDTSALSRVPTSVHRAVDLVRTGVLTATVRSPADVLVIHAVNLVSGAVLTCSVLDCALSPATDLAVISRAPQSCHVDTRVSGFVEKRVPPSVECVTVTRSPKSSSEMRMNRTPDSFSLKTANIYLRFSFVYFVNKFYASAVCAAEAITFPLRLSSVLLSRFM